MQTSYTKSRCTNTTNQAARYANTPFKKHTQKVYSIGKETQCNLDYFKTSFNVRQVADNLRAWFHACAFCILLLEFGSAKTHKAIRDE